MRPNRLQRRYRRNQRAALAASQREAADPWEQARVRARELHAPPAAALLIDALAERHRKLGKGMKHEPVFCGYGGRGRTSELRDQPAERVGLAELTGRARRTMIRARHWLTDRGVLHVLLGGGQVERRVRRTKQEGPPRFCLIGRGGCDKGGEGIANAYLVDGMPMPEPPEPPEPPPVGQRPAGWERVMAEQREREQEHLRQRAGEQARGP